MYKNFNLTDKERKEILEQHGRYGYKKPLNENIFGASGWEGGAGDKDSVGGGEKIDNNVGELNYNEQSGNMESFEKLKEMISSPCEISDVETWGRNRGHFVCKNENSRLEVGFMYDDISVKPKNIYFYSTDGNEDFEYMINVDDFDSMKYIFNKVVDESDLMDMIKNKSDYTPDDTDMPGFEGTMDNLDDLSIR